MVTANKMVLAPGDTVTISCTVSNPGTSDLENVTISEADIGELFTIDGLVAGETQTLNYDISVQESTTLTITAVGDNGSEKEWLISKTIDLIVDEGLEALDIVFEAAASETMLEFPGMVVFNITVENTGSEIYNNLQVKDKDGQVIEEIHQLVPGKSQFQVNTNVQKTDTYFFILSVPNDGGETQNISTTPIEITVTESQNGTETAETEQPGTSFVPTEFDNDRSEPVADSRTLTFLIIILGLILFAAVASLVKSIRR